MSLNFFVQVRVPAHNHAPQDVAVAVQGLGEAVDHQVGVHFQGTLAVGRGKGVVHHQQGAGGPGQTGGRAKIGELHGGVGGCFQKEQLGTCGQGLFQLSQV